MRPAVLLSALPLALAAPNLNPRVGQVIPGKYIIKMKTGATQAHMEEVLSLMEEGPAHTYTFGKFKGFAGSMSDAIANNVAALDAVEYIEKDAIVTTKAYITESGAPWGLGRISLRTNGSTEYVYDNSAGEGTCSYVIDTGILVTHPEFEGRATWLENFSGDGQDSDGYGHGTHVAGTIGSVTYGVAKKTSLFAVKVLDSSGSGTYSSVIAGINYAANDSTTRDCPNGSVANMSLGGGKSDAVNSAVESAVAAGLFMAVAAGNDADDTANYSPSSAPDACTVGASDTTDTMAYFSNYGTLVDVFAPGVDVLSTWNDGGTNTISGTSMATPHITGLGAYLLTLEGSMDPVALCQRIQALATTDVLADVPSGTINALAFNGNPTG